VREYTNFEKIMIKQGPLELSACPRDDKLKSSVDVLSRWYAFHAMRSMRGGLFPVVV
jgi:hypothetical protein